MRFRIGGRARPLIVALILAVRPASPHCPGLRHPSGNRRDNDLRRNRRCPDPAQSGPEHELRLRHRQPCPIRQRIPGKRRRSDASFPGLQPVPILRDRRIQLSLLEFHHDPSRRDGGRGHRPCHPRWSRWRPSPVRPGSGLFPPAPRSPLHRQHAPDLWRPDDALQRALARSAGDGGPVHGLGRHAPIQRHGHPDIRPSPGGSDPRRRRPPSGRPLPQRGFTR